MEGYFTESETAKKLGTATQTLRVWACRRKGPPRTKVGRKIFYKEESGRLDARAGANLRESGII